MRIKKTVTWTLLACVVLVLLGSATLGCGTPIPQEPTEPPETAVVPPPTEKPAFQCSPLPPDDSTTFYPEFYAVSEEEPFLEGLVVVTGRDESDISRVIEEAFGGSSEPIESISFAGLLIQIYDYSDYFSNATVWDVVLAIYEAALANSVNVYAEPDYVFGHPWDIQGSPWDIQGSPFGGGGQVEGSNAEDLFWGQWALAEGGSGVGHSGSGGSGVQVAVFDTSPFLEPGPYTFDFTNGPDLNLCVSHPVPLSVPYTFEDEDYSEHGFAVAGLVHAVASDSTIHLIRVLNDQNQGDLFTLLKAISMYLQSIVGDGTPVDEIKQDAFEGVVINLSLGLSPDYGTPDDPVKELFQDLDFRQWFAAGGAELIEGESIPAPALRFLTLFATRHGAVVVAAAGNESSPDVAKSARRPALWPEVVGVGASTLAAKGGYPARACYSNLGDVYAPGGDGDGTCTPSLASCTNTLPMGCEFGLISLVTRQDSSGNVTGHQYAYWVGTSFATPLVSGFAALGTPSSLVDYCEGEEPPPGLGPICVATPPPVP